MASTSPRLRRLMADYELIRNEFTGHPRIDVQPAGGYPPERYLVAYRVKGVEAIDRHEMPVLRNEHVAVIYLHEGYPREKPKCVLRTPIFHPNIEPSHICVGDYWTAGERLIDLIIRIGEMIAFQAYNIKSPLDGEAAMWADLNRDRMPVDNRELAPPGMY